MWKQQWEFFFLDKTNTKWLCQCMWLITSSVVAFVIASSAYCWHKNEDFFVQKNHSHQYDMLGSQINKQMLIYVTSRVTPVCIYCRGKNNIYENPVVWPYEKIYAFGMDEYSFWSGCMTHIDWRHDCEYHPNITHIWVYAGLEPQPD